MFQLFVAGASKKREVVQVTQVLTANKLSPRTQAHTAAENKKNATLHPSPSTADKSRRKESKQIITKVPFARRKSSSITERKFDEAYTGYGLSTITDSLLVVTVSGERATIAVRGYLRVPYRVVG
ncbi:unnamed protein product, partial [Callosobruchus maculatus]